MTEHRLYFATNRNHVGQDRWHPDSYGTKFSNDGMENLRFGVVTVTADEKTVEQHLKAKIESCGAGDGESLGKHLAACAQNAKISAYEETIGNHVADTAQKEAKFGSRAMFSDVQTAMENSSDVLLYIHGFNVSWHQAVGSTLALQIMLQNTPTQDPTQNIAVILFTWPSDGMALPWASYKSDRSEATGSGAAVGRAFLKARLSRRLARPRKKRRQ